MLSYHSRRIQYFILGLFTLKIPMHVVVRPCIMAMNLIINKNSTPFFHHYRSATIEKCSSKLVYLSESLRILLNLKYALVCSLYARLFIARMAFFWRTKIVDE